MRRITQPEEEVTILSEKGGSCEGRIYKFVQKTCDEVVDVEMKDRTTLNKFVLWM